MIAWGKAIIFIKCSSNFFITESGFETCFGWGRRGQTTDARVLVGTVGTPGTKGAGFLYAQDKVPYHEPTSVQGGIETVGS